MSKNKTESMQAIGQILRNLREERNMPLQAAHDATGIELTLLSRIETGKRLPTDEQLAKLAQVYNFDMRNCLFLVRFLVFLHLYYRRLIRLVVIVF